MTREERSRQSAIKAIYQNSISDKLKGTFQSGDKWAVCDGFRFIRTSNRPKDIPDCTGMDLGRVTENVERGKVVCPPSAHEINEFIKERFMTRHRNLLPIEALPGWWCNPFYLLDMVKAMPDAVYYKPKNRLSPLYCESEDGDALLLPVRRAG